jgi:predicted acetyltransferase
VPLTRLLRPAEEHLPEYVAALARGFEPSNWNGKEVARAHLAAIEADPAAFLAGLDDPEGRGPPVVLPDGSRRPRLPGYTRWIWDRGFCGVIHFRWQPGTTALPPHVLGHSGYVIAPWRRGEGHATRALGLLLAEVAPLGLPFIEVTTDAANLASIRVVERNGGVLVERFTRLPAHGGGEALRWRLVPKAPSAA